MSAEVVRQGWGWPMLARKAHYFVDMFSLCGRWMFTGELDDDDNDKTGPDDCVACRRVLGRRRTRV